jgi:hypothetical protein
MIANRLSLVKITPIKLKCIKEPNDYNEYERDGRFDRYNMFSIDIGITS